MKIDWELRKTREGTVRYLMVQDGCTVTGMAPCDAALKMLWGKDVYASNAYEGYPLTADGVYYFDGVYRVYE